jgi:hypothetical protein
MVVRFPMCEVYPAEPGPEPVIPEIGILYVINQQRLGRCITCDIYYKSGYPSHTLADADTGMRPPGDSYVLCSCVPVVQEWPKYVVVLC